MNSVRQVSPWLVLVTVMVGTLLIGLDRTVASIAVPKIIDDFGITVSAASWISTSYIISNAVFVPVFGKLGDLYGNKVIYLWSFVGFIVISMLAGLSWNFASLLVFRALQGLVGAAVYPTAMSLIAKSFTDIKARAQALGIWSASFAASAVIGPLLGGYLIDNFSWRFVFYINLPIGIVGLLMTLAFIRADKPSARGAFDYLGSIILAVAISGAVLVLDQGESWGWISLSSVACYLTSAVFGYIFYLYERHHPNPIIDFKFFRNPIIVSVLLVSFISFGGMMGAMFILPVFSQSFLGFDAFKSGLLFVPLAVALFIFAPIGAKLSSTIHPRYLVAFGTLVSAFGLYLLHSIDAASTAVSFILPLGIFGGGLALGMGPLTTASTTAVPQNEVGMSSGLLNLARNIGGAFGIAIFGTILTGLINKNVLQVAHDTIINSNAPGILTEERALVVLKAEVISYGQVFEFGAGAMVLGALAALLLRRHDRPSNENGHAFVEI